MNHKAQNLGLGRELVDWHQRHFLSNGCSQDRYTRCRADTAVCRTTALLKQSDAPNDPKWCWVLDNTPKPPYITEGIGGILDTGLPDLVLHLFSSRFSTTVWYVALSNATRRRKNVGTTRSSSVDKGSQFWLAGKITGLCHHRLMGTACRPNLVRRHDGN